MLYTIDDIQPELADDVFVADNATVIGRVRLEAGASVWFNCVLRGDVEALHIGTGSNIQDGSVLHADPGFPLRVGENVTVGHMVMLHGCSIGDNSLIGIGAIVLNGAKIGRNCIIGAGTLIPEGKEIPDSSLVMGAPGKVVRECGDKERAAIAASAEHYVDNGRRYREGLVGYDAK
ncbi:gamma carbonic anhydrase family protein [Algiphilus aromaticivorans]|uniref:gamma carbonic anhydrase family protein n=1 Tax=Algiphilus aromaticivorans TaxID=382454 RepID=UPI0005C23A4A|nr:gamma carbonic anhydrase family protein [Algiphilus aromaticivorans]